MFSNPVRGNSKFIFEGKRFVVNNNTDIPIDILQALVDFYETNRAQAVELEIEGRERLTLLFRDEEAVLIVEDGGRIDRTSYNITLFAKEVCADFEEDLDNWTDFCSYKGDSREVWNEKNDEIQCLIDQVKGHCGVLKRLVIKDGDVYDCAFICPDEDKDCAFCQFFNLMLKKLYDYEEKEEQEGK